MVDKKKDCLINERSGCPEQLSAKKLCLENASNRDQLGAPKSVDEHPPERFAQNLFQYLLQFFCKFTLNTANSCINSIDKLKTQLEDVDLLGEKELKSCVLSETMNSDILPYALGEKKNDVLTYVYNAGNNRIYFNKERREEPFNEDVYFPEEYTESLVWKTALMRCAHRLETNCDRLLPLMKGHFETESIYCLLDSKGSNSKPLREQQVKQVLEKMLRGKNLMEVLLFLISSCEFDALMDYLNEQKVPSTNRRCLGGDTNGSPGGILRFLTKFYRELLRGIPSIVSKINVKALPLKDFMVIKEIRDILNVNSIHTFQNAKETLKTGNPKGMAAKEGLTSIASKGKVKLLAMVFKFVLSSQIETKDIMLSMTPCTQKEASPVTASSASSSLSQSESLSSLGWEDPPTDTLRQLLDIAMGREQLPPDASSSFIIQVPIIDLMAKSDEEPERDLSQSVASSLNGSETKESNLTETFPPAKEDENYQTLEKNFKLVQFVINQLTLKQFYEQEKRLKM